MSEQYLHLDSIMSNPNNTIRLYLSSGNFSQGLGDLIKGYLYSDIRISGSNEFDAPFNNDLDSIQDLLLRAEQTGTQLGAKIPNFILKSVQQTISSWKGSERFTLPVEMLLINYKRKNEVVLSNLKKLITTVYPTSIGNASLENLSNNTLSTLTDFSLTNINNLFGSFQMTAPRGYGVEYKSGVPVTTGACYIAIGKWFVGRDLLVKNLDFNVSQKTLDDGRPVFATVSFTLESFKMLSAEEVSSFIIEPSLGGNI